MRNNSIFITDICYSINCELFESEGGIDILDKFVDETVQWHHELASMIRENVRKWKVNRKYYIEGMLLPVFALKRKSVI